MSPDFVFYLFQNSNIESVKHSFPSNYRVLCRSDCDHVCLYGRVTVCMDCGVFSEGSVKLMFFDVMILLFHLLQFIKFSS